MSDILIVHQFENMISNVFGMHLDFIILHVSTIMEVPLLRLQIGPCLKWYLLQHSSSMLIKAFSNSEMFGQTQDSNTACNPSKHIVHKYTLHWVHLLMH